MTCDTYYSRSSLMLYINVHHYFRRMKLPTHMHRCHLHYWIPGVCGCLLWLWRRVQYVVYGKLYNELRVVIYSGGISLSSVSLWMNQMNIKIFLMEGDEIGLGVSIFLFPPSSMPISSEFGIPQHWGLTQVLCALDYVKSEIGASDFLILELEWELVWYNKWERAMLIGSLGSQALIGTLSVDCGRSWPILLSGEEKSKSPSYSCLHCSRWSW